MKPVALDIQRTGSLGGTEVTMTFDENSIAHIMSVLTDLYSDSELAVIREYSTNAHDSHIEAGQTRPIEVTLPNAMNPYLVIKDYGVGMSKEDIVNTYSKYGASTKRETNDQSGTLGLGCKSALTYTSQFQVTAIKDGIKTIVNVSRNSDGSGVMELVSSKPTDEPNGVEISIPTNSRHDSLRAKAEKFFSYWHPGAVLLNGEEPSKIKGINLGDNMVLVEGLEEDIVVMGNVAYRVNSEHHIAAPASYWKHAGVVAWLPIGSVAFTPNREDLRYTELTKKVLFDQRVQFNKLFNEKIKAEIDACQTPAEGLSQYVKLQKRFGELKGFSVAKEWRGRSFAKLFQDTVYTRFDVNASRYQISQRTGITLDMIVNWVFISGRPDVEISSTHKAKIRQLLSDNGIRASHVVIFREGVDLGEWLDNSTMFTWEEVKAVQLTDKASYRGGGLRGKQKFRLVRQWDEELVEELDETRPIYYATYKDFDYYNARRAFDLDVDQVVLLSANRHDKFVRDYPHALTVRAGIQKKRQEYLDNVPHHVLDSFTLDNTHVLKKLDATMVDDPELARQIELAKEEHPEWVTKYSAWGTPNGYKRPKSALRKYPLVPTGVLAPVKCKEHIYMYVNAVYNSKESK